MACKYVVHNTEKAYLHSTSCVWAFSLNFWFKVWARAVCFSLRYSVSYTYIKLWQNITQEDDIMMVEIYISQKLEMCINTNFKNTLPNYTETDILTKKISAAACRLGWTWYTIYEPALYNEKYDWSFIDITHMNII